jgi:hypothetical protein
MTAGLPAFGVATKDAPPSTKTHLWFAGPPFTFIVGQSILNGATCSPTTFYMSPLAVGLPQSAVASFANPSAWASAYARDDPIVRRQPVLTTARALRLKPGD